MKRINFLLIASLGATFFSSCRLQSFPDESKFPYGRVDATEGTVSKVDARENLQSVLNVIYSVGESYEFIFDALVCDLEINNIMSGCLSSSTGENEKECVLYAVPLIKGGYAIVSANDNEIYSVIPDGKITQEAVNDQIMRAWKQIRYEDRLFQLENYILGQKATSSSPAASDLGDVVYSECWNNQVGYTVWYDEQEKVRIYTLGYSDGDNGQYIATYFLRDGVLSREAGNDAINEQKETALITSLAENTNQMSNATAEAQEGNFGIYLAVRDWLADGFKVSSDAMDSGINMCVTLCKSDNKKTLSYGLAQSEGKFGSAFANGSAGSGAIAIATIFMQQGLVPSKIDSQWTDWNSFEKGGCVETSAGWVNGYTQKGQEEFSRLLQSVSTQCGSVDFADETFISRNHFGGFLNQHFSSVSADVDYVTDLVKEQIGQNRLSILYQRSVNGVGSLSNAHYWTATAYADIVDASQKQTLVYYNTGRSARQDAPDGWYNIGEHPNQKFRLFEP